MLLMHSFFVVAFFPFFSLHYVCILVCYKIDAISSNAHRSVIRITQVIDLENFYYLLHVIIELFENVFNEKMTLCNNGFLIYLYLLDPSVFVI